MRFAFVILLAIAVSAQSVHAQRFPPAGLVSSKRLVAAGGGGGSPTYIIKQDFEGTGYDNGETWNEFIDANVDADYATSPAPLVGSQSLKVGVVETYNQFTGVSEIYGYFQCYMSDISGADFIFSFRTSGDANQMRVRILSDGAIRIYDSANNTTDSSAGAFAQGSVNHVWVYYLKGTGANGVLQCHVAATDTKPGSPTVATTTSASTANVA